MKMEASNKYTEYKNVMCIYKIENKFTGKVYIGSTTNLKSRIRSHIKELINNTHENKSLQNSWNVASSKDNFSFEIVEIVDDETFLPFAELYYIEKYRRLNGVYNFSNPLEEQSLLKNREKNKQIRTMKTKKKLDDVSEILMSEFENIFISLKKKTEKDVFIEFSKLNDYILNNTSIKNYDSKEIENKIIKLLKMYDLSVYNFESPFYNREVLNKNGIYTYKRLVISKALGKTITNQLN